MLGLVTVAPRNTTPLYTELYATVAHMSNDDNANRKLGTSLSHTVLPGKNVTGYEVGMRHNF